MPTAEALTRCLEHVAVAFHGRQVPAARRWRLLESHDALRERELVKMAAAARTLAGCLGRRGLGEPAATVTAEAIVAAFRTAYARWALLDDEPNLGKVARDVMAALCDASAVGGEHRER